MIVFLEILQVKFLFIQNFKACSKTVGKTTVACFFPYSVCFHGLYPVSKGVIKGL